jgi:Notch 1
MGNEVCVGTTIGPEQCNCEDNDCDGNSDESGTCPAGSTCTSCQCAFPCDDSEFPCPAGKVCVEGVCLVDNCAGVTCPPDGNGDATVCIADAAPSTGHSCEPACDHLNQPCPTGTVCFGPTGLCAFDDCRTFPERCTETELCVVEDGVASCVADPCAGVNCGDEQYCLGGQCLASCGDVDCALGDRCVLGECEPDPCGGPCITNHVCNDALGECVVNPCLGQACPGEACDPQTGECIADPCIGVTCPGDDLCRLGTCYDPSYFQPDAEGPEQHVTTGGGGGCQTGGRGGAAGAGIVLAALALAARRRRRGAGGAA